MFIHAQQDMTIVHHAHLYHIQNENIAKKIDLRLIFNVNIKL